MNFINVDADMLIQSASRIEDENQMYQQAFMQLFQAVDTMEEGWKGKDNTAFSSQIHRFEADFREMSALCGQYSEFLRNAANAYREAQDSIAAQAAGLGQ